MKHIFIVLFILFSFHSYAQKFFYHETSFDKMNGVIGLHISYLNFEITDKVKLNKIHLFSDKTLKEKIDQSNFENHFHQKTRAIVDLDSLYFGDFYDINPIGSWNKININPNGFEFIFNPRDWGKSRNYGNALKDTDIIIFYIDNKNLNMLTTSPLGKYILLHYQRYHKEIQEISYKNFATFFVDMQREMLNPQIRKYVKRIEGFEYKNLDSTMSNELSNLRYFKYTKRFDPSLALDDVIRNSKMIIDYDMDSKSGKFILNGIGFDFCPGECMRGGVYYPYYQFSVEPENFKSVFSAHNIDLIYLLIDSYVNRMNCDN